MKKKLLSLLLALAMLLTLLPQAGQTVGAEELPQDPAAEQTETTTKDKQAQLRRAGPEELAQGRKDALELRLDEACEVVIPEPGERAWLYFIPRQAGWYELRSQADSEDTCCTLYDAAGQELAWDDDGGEGANFCIRCWLEAGERYDYNVWYYSQEMAGSFPVLLTSFEPPTSGRCGEDLSWSFDNDSGLLTIEGSGDMWDFDGWFDRDPGNGDAVPWSSVRSRITGLSLPEALTSIGTDAFAMCDNLTEVTVPEAVTRVEDYAFAPCRGLLEITILNSGCELAYDSIGGNAELVIYGYTPSSARSYARDHEFAFVSLGENDLEGVCGWELTWHYDVETGLLRIEGEGDMWDFGAARGDGYYSASSAPWRDCFFDITAISLPEGLTSIGMAAFTGCSQVTELEIPAGVTRIGDYAFGACSALTGLVLPEQLGAIGAHAFSFCEALTEVELPAGVASVGDNAFSACTALRSITFLNSDCEIADGCLEGSDNVTVYGYSYSTAERYAEEYGLPFVSIGMPELGGRCGDALTWRFDPETGLLAIEGEGDMYDFDVVLSDYGDELYVPWRVFQDSIRELALPEGLTHIGNWAFRGMELDTEPVLPDSLRSIGDGAFNWCGGIYSLRLPEGLERIGREAFRDCDSLTELVLPDSLTAIGERAFIHCDNLETVTLGGQIREMGKEVFADNDSLTDVYLTAGFSLDYRETNIPGLFCEYGDFTFVEKGDFCFDLSAFHADPQNQVFSTDEAGVLYNKAQTELIMYPTGRVGEYTLPETVEGICEKAFFNCDGLTKLSFPESLETIGDLALAFCDGLTQLRFPTGLRVIGNAAFMHCAALRSVRVPGAVEIGSEAFAQCPELLEFVIRNPESSVCGYRLMQGIQYPNLDDTDEDFEPYPWQNEVEYSDTLGNPWRTLVFGVHDPEKEDGELMMRPPVGDADYSSADGYRWVENYAKTYDYTFCNIGAFNDVTPDSYYELPVAWAVTMGITSGTGAGQFSPKKTCTREQVVTFLWKAIGAPQPESSESPFSDVTPGKYYFKAVLWAAENGITGGVGGGKFGVGRGCTREQVMTFLWKALGSPLPRSTESPFTDVAEGKYYFKPVLWAVENGITSGVSADSFGVGKTCTRAQIVTFLYTALVKSRPTGSDAYTRGDDEAVYYQNLGDFDWRMQQAEEAEYNDERFVSLAQAEAELLDSAVMIPTTASGGAYAISREAPHSRPFVHWGSDGDRLHSLVISEDFLTRGEREELEALWEQAVAGEGDYDPAAWLRSRGHSLLPGYAASYTVAPETLDWLATARKNDSMILANCVEGLVEYDSLGNLRPALAESWTITEEGTCYTFHIRDDVWWYTADGEAYAKLTAYDFAAGFRHMLDMGTGLEGLAGEGVAEISGVEAYLWEDASFDSVGCEALDAHTLRFTLNQPVPFFMSILSSSAFLPMCESFYQSRGGVFGAEACWEAQDNGSYRFGQIDDIGSQVYCGPFLPQRVDPESEVLLVKNEGYYGADAVTLETLRWICALNESAEELYTQTVNGVFTGIELSAQGGTLELAQNDGSFERCAYVTEPSTTTYLGMLNLNRGSFGLENGACSSPKTELEKIDALTALNNRSFRKALMHAFDKTAYNAVSRGWELAENNLRNTFTPPRFVKLEHDYTDQYGHTFPAGSFYGELVQYYCDEKGCQVDCRDGVDGWYKPELAAQYLADAVEELGGKVQWPIQIDLVYNASSAVQTEQAMVYKESVEGALGSDYVCVNLIEAADFGEYLDSCYYAETGAACNYDMFFGTGWAPDYGDPASYLYTFRYNVNGFLLKFLGLF